MKLYLFKLGLVHPFGVPVPGYLIQTDNGKHILVDTGFPYSFIEHPKNPHGVHFEMKEEDYIVNRLYSIGILPDDIDFLISTHFDTDHAGNNEVFKNAQLIVQRSHYEVAKAGHPRFEDIKTHWDAPELNYRMVDGDTTLWEGVELVETSGHVPGHQSVIVDLKDSGKVLLAIDAIPAPYLTDPDTRLIMPTDMDEAGVRLSTKKLMDIVKSQNIKLLIHGHDMDQWRTLKHAPLYYN
jgi:N-acyl homoserine lactone hydrolase